MQCWNCNMMYNLTDNNGLCPECNESNDIEELSNEDEEQCCNNCKYYEPDNPINCPRLATKLKWDRDTFEVDDPSIFKCSDHSL